MKNWFEKKSTTNILLLGIAILLGAHLLMNLPLLPQAKAQSQDTSNFSNSLTNQKVEAYLKSMDQNILDIKNSSISMRTDLRYMQGCIITTPTGGKAFVTKASD